MQHDFVAVGELDTVMQLGADRDIADAHRIDHSLADELAGRDGPANRVLRRIVVLRDKAQVLGTDTQQAGRSRRQPRGIGRGGPEPAAPPPPQAPTPPWVRTTSSMV